MINLKKSMLPFLWRHFPKFIIKMEWKKKGKEFNWDNPKDLNEKILWFLFNSDTSEWTRLSDKYRVREFVKERGLDDLLVRLYGKWDNANDIDYDALPNRFVLKCNHDCGSYHIIDKQKGFDKELINMDLNNHINIKFGAYGGELHYTKIKPCIIAEEFLESKSDKFSSSLVDYKVWCFDGKPFCIFVAYDRKENFLHIDVYDLEWNNHPEWLVFNKHYQRGDIIVQKPNNLDKMIEAASILSKGFPEVRVDFYDVDGKLYFGEMTFTSATGRMDYFTDEFLIEMGNQIPSSYFKL